MPECLPEAVQGLKTFFVVPDRSLFPEEFLRSFYLRGYETYFLEDDPYCSLETKISRLFSLFPQLILFFNIDRPIQGIEWPVFIGALQREYGNRAMIGVMFHKRTNHEETKRLERLYLYTIGIICGCISLEYQKSKNLYLFLNVLAANQANGQRKYLRAMCDESYKATLAFEGVTHRVALRDLSVSHFSCVFPGAAPEIPLHEKLYEIQLSLHGAIIRVDGVLCLKRILEDAVIHVFVFRSREDREGLDPEHLVRVNDIIANEFISRMQELLRAEFASARGKERVIIPDEARRFTAPRKQNKARGSLPDAESILDLLR